MPIFWSPNFFRDSPKAQLMKQFQVRGSTFLRLMIVAVGGFIAAAAMLIVFLFIWDYTLLIIALLTLSGTIAYFLYLFIEVQIKKPEKDEQVPEKNESAIPSKEQIHARISNGATAVENAVDMLVKIIAPNTYLDGSTHKPKLAVITGPVRNIGQALNDLGGMDLMKKVFDQFRREMPEMGRTVEMLWDRIGTWQGL